MRIEYMRDRVLRGKKVRVDEEAGRIQLREEWKEFIMTLLEVKELRNLKRCYGYRYNYSFTEDEISCEYFIGMKEDDYTAVPEGFDSAVIPGGKYAVYTYRGYFTSEGMSEFYRNIFYKWLKEDGLEHRIDASFEYYDERYVEGSRDAEFEVWVPVK